jgi:hypothetical protein
MLEIGGGVGFWKSSKSQFQISFLNFFEVSVRQKLNFEKNALDYSLNWWSGAWHKNLLKMMKTDGEESFLVFFDKTYYTFMWVRKLGCIRLLTFWKWLRRVVLYV